jgi:hypothetical protein
MHLFKPGAGKTTRTKKIIDDVPAVKNNREG